jgi:hypothetical protein
VECAPRGFQRRSSIVREGAADGRTVALDALGFRVAPPCEPPFDGTYSSHPLLQFFLGMAVGCINRLGRLTEKMAVAAWVGDIGEYRCDGTAEGQLAVRNAADNRHLHGLPHRPEQLCQVRLGR